MVTGTMITRGTITPVAAKPMLMQMVA